jgi:rubrerythrin
MGARRRSPPVQEEESQTVSRIPRSQEHLKTAFTAEAVTAAHYRAYATWAREEGLPNLAERWLELAAGKDELAVKLLRAAGQVEGSVTDVKSALSEDRYENDVLYPKMVRDLDAAASDLFLALIARQKDHIRELTTLRKQLLASETDIEGRPTA